MFATEIENGIDYVRYDLHIPNQIEINGWYFANEFNVYQKILAQKFIFLKSFSRGSIS